MQQSKPKILIADNDPAHLRQYRKYLELGGYEVSEARDPDEARAALEQGIVDLAILDLRLTNNDDEMDVSGLDVAREVMPSIPKIILTLYPDYPSVRGSLAPTDDGPPPAVYYVYKNDGLEALLQRVKLALQPLRERRITDERPPLS